MDETVGDVPSEGGDSSRRFGIYASAFATEPRVCSTSRLSLLFIACVAGVVAFAVFFPMLQFASRSSRSVLPFPEIANKSTEKDASNTNCSSNELSFGHDCTLASQTNTKVTTTNIAHEDYTHAYTESSQFEASTVSTTLDDSEVVAETRQLKILRTGRSGWPEVSTPYPYYIPKPHPAIADRIKSDAEEASVFPIPDGADQENVTRYLKTKPRVNFTPPPYAFTPFPNFTDSYAQLLPYKVAAHYTHLEDVVRYMKNDDSNSRSSTERPPGNRRLATMKVSGTYRMPLDRRRPDDPTSGSEKVEEARPFFNGHAYVTDPFVKFRPANPIEVNRLVPLRPDIGSRFRRPFTKPPKPQAEVPEESRDRDLHAAGGSYTEAIFGGAGSVPQPSDLLTPPAPEPASFSSGSSSKPLSVTLDIYPVTMEMPVSEPPRGSSVPPWRDRGRFRIAQRPRWRPQAVRRPTAETRPPPPQHQPPPNPADNHMVVHLNLFPTRRKPYTFARRRGEENTHQGNTKATILGRSHLGARSRASLPDHLEGAQYGDELRATIAPFSTSTESPSSSAKNPPQFSALTGDPQKEADGEITTLYFVENISSKNDSVTTDSLHLENNDTNIITEKDFVKNDSTGHLKGVTDKEKSAIFFEAKNETEELSNRAKSMRGDNNTSDMSSKSKNGTDTVDEIMSSEKPGVVMEDDNAFVSTESLNDIT